MSARAIGYWLAFASAAAGAARYNLAVYAESLGFSYVPFLAYALAVGILCCTIHVAVRDGMKGFVPLRGAWHRAFLYGLLMAWSTLSHFLALIYLNETVMVSLAQTGILVTIALAVWLLGERFTPKQWLATGAICIGVFLFRPWEAVRITGFLILMSGVVGGAFATIGAKRWVKGVPPRVLMLWRNGVAFLLVFVWSLFQAPPSVTLATAAACVAAGILGPYLHGLFFLQALERIDAAKASLMNRVQPAIVFVLSLVFLHHVPERQDIFCAALLVAGTLWLAAQRTTSPGRSGASRR